MTPCSTRLAKIVAVVGNIALLAVLPLTAAIVISSVA